MLRVASEVSALLLTASKANYATVIESSLQRIGESIGADAGRVWWLRDDSPKRADLSLSQSWQKVDAPPAVTPQFDLREFEWLYSALQPGLPVCIRSLEDIPEEARAERTALSMAGIKSSLMLPIVRNQEFIGLCNFTSVTTERRWHDFQINWAASMVNKIASAYEKIELQKKIELKLKDEELLSSISSSFLRGGVQQHPDLIRSALAQVGEHFKASAVIICAPAGRSLQRAISFHWLASDGDSTTSTAEPCQLPEKLLAQVKLNYQTSVAFTPESISNAGEKQCNSSFEFVSGIAMGIRYHGEYWGSMILLANEREFWSKESDIILATIAESIVSYFEQSMLLLKLETNQKLYKDIVSAQDELIARWGPDHSCRFGNESFLQFTESDSSAVPNASSQALLGDEFSEHLQNAIEAAADTQKVYAFSTEHKMPDGSFRHFDWTAKGFYETNTRDLVEIQTVGRDKTDLVVKTQVIRSLDAGMEEISEEFDSITWAMNQESRFIFVSRFVKARLGIPENMLKALGLDAWLSRVHPGDKSTLRNLRTKACRTGESYTFDYQIRNAEEKWIWMQDRCVRHTDKEGLNFLFGVSVDITDQKNYEIGLENERKYIECMVNAQQEILLVFDLATRKILRWNTYFEDHVDLHGSQISNSCFPADIVESQFCKDVDSRIRKLVTGTDSTIDVPINGKGGNLEIYEFICSRLDLADPSRTHIVALGRNVTSQRREEAIQRSRLDELESEKVTLSAQNSYLAREIFEVKANRLVVGNSRKMRECLELTSQVAPTDAIVMILGETGTGKELIAEEIHKSSNRADKPLIKVNCASLPTSLIESELFGHQKGAFTGAVQRRSGRFQMADGGTLFLDEVSEIPLDIQAKLLRVIQDGTFEPLGSSTTVSVDTRIIAASNKDLTEEVAAGNFREDLYFRLNVFPLHIPPLREREEDIELLLRYYLHHFSVKYNKQYESISKSSISALLKYEWPGNVRELKHLIERSVIKCSCSHLEIDLPDIGLRCPVTKATPERRNVDSLKESERAQIINALEQANWIIEGANGAAAILQIPPSTLRSKMRKHRIRRSHENRGYAQEMD